MTQKALVARLLFELNPGYLWAYLDIAYGLEGLPSPRFYNPGSPPRDWRVTRATLTKALARGTNVPNKTNTVSTSTKEHHV